MIDRKDTEMDDLDSLPSPPPPPFAKDANTDSNNNASNHGSQLRSSSRVAEKYGLRPRTIIRRMQLERKREELPLKRRPETKSLKKIRPPPLSKYRRKTANARERHRMKEINTAFETLRQILPDFCSRRVASAMTKITTLKLAVNYIRALSHILEDGHPGDISFFDGLNLDELAMCSSPEATTQLSSSTHGLQYHHHGGLLPHQMLTVPSPVTSSTSSPTTVRASLGSNSDLSDLLSDDSCVFDDNLNAFNDIPAFPGVDAFTLLMVPDGITLTPGS